MQFIYDKNASKEFLTIKDENYRYLFRVRRSKVGDIVDLRNLSDNFLYQYEIKNIDKKEAFLYLIDSVRREPKKFKKLHLIWCIIDPKIVYSTLPMLNQIGLFKISFVYCDRSQKNFKIDLEKCNKILINSCQQSGRADIMKLEIFDDLDEAIELYKDIAVLDFGGEESWKDISCVLVGCEGGFSQKEREKLKNHYKIGLKTDFILKSETAVLTIAAKLLI